MVPITFIFSNVIYYILYTIYYILYTIYYLLYTIYYIPYTIYYIPYVYLVLKNYSELNALFKIKLIFIGYFRLTPTWNLS